MKVLIRFPDRHSVPYWIVDALLTDLNDEIFNNERHELEEIRDQFPDIPRVAVDAALHRLGNYRNSAIFVEAIKPGSVEIAIGISALAWWLLENTVGETVKDAWKETGLNEKLRGYLLAGARKRLPEVISPPAIRPRYRYRDLQSTSLEESSVGFSDDGETLIVEVRYKDSREVPPTYDDIA